MKADGECIQFNESNWGLCNFDLPEAAFGDDCSDEFQKLSNIYLSKENLRVTSIKPQYDLDRLTLIYERKHSRKGSKGNGMNGEMQLYLPDATGSYSEENSVKRIIPVGFAGNIIFEIESLNNYALRLDPLNIRGMINVNSLIVMDPATGTMLLNVAGKKLSKLFDCAKDALLMQHFESVVFNCLSHDPQVIMRLEKYSQYEKLTLILNVDFPEFISS
jgi:hypothetical protein